ncbi:MAG: NTP transferase domain-containing protein [Candidatus Hodarchaeota archaeon]
MEIRLLLQENKLIKKVIVIIPCAGEGTRIQDITQNIPKALIKIAALNNTPIIDQLVLSLTKIGIKKIAIITGHLGSKLKEHVERYLTLKSQLKNKLILIDSGQEYKKGPLYSFLSIINNNEIFRKKYIYALFPCDTIFQNTLIKEIFKIISLNLKSIKSTPIVIYKNVNTKLIKQLYKETLIESFKYLSILNTKKINGKENLIEISKIDLKLIPKGIIKLMVPVLIFDYNFVKQILEVSNLTPAKTISKALNILIKRGKMILTYKVNPDLKFYDIDDKYDLMLINSMEKKMDNSSFE